MKLLYLAARSDALYRLKNTPTPQLSIKQRQWLQVSSTPFVAKNSLAEAIASFKPPFHFIDFETTMVAVPFFKSGRPYSQIAFQFSHHVMHADGRIEHAGQYFNDVAGKFPNFDFVRALKAQLSNDDGTIFRFADHENTVLNQITKQLEESTEADKDELIGWIRTITSDKKNGRVGVRTMIDLCDLVRRYYYSPVMKGSASIKKVLPAVLQESKFLKSKYGKPIYGTPHGIKSLNFKNWAWLDENECDPYKKLPKVFAGDKTESLKLLSGNDELADGGAAMSAYALMQFTQMTEFERTQLKEALLKYCELDTLAMVMIFEHWINETLEVKNEKKRFGQAIE